MPKLSEVEHQRRMELYEQGLNGREIADKLGLAKSTIFSWRKSNNLSANVNKGKLSRQEVKQRIELIYKGLSDKEIADMLGMDTKIFTNWRCRRRIEGNKKYESIKLPKDEHNRRMKLYEKGLDDSEIVEKLELKRECVSQWRERNNFSPNKETIPKFHQLKEKGFGKRRIARKTGLPVGIVGMWLYKGVKPRSMRLAEKYGK